MGSLHLLSNRGEMVGCWVANNRWPPQRISRDTSQVWYVFLQYSEFSTCLADWIKLTIFFMIYFSRIKEALKSFIPNNLNSTKWLGRFWWVSEELPINVKTRHSFNTINSLLIDTRNLSRKAKCGNRNINATGTHGFFGSQEFMWPIYNPWTISKKLLF